MCRDVGLLLLDVRRRTVGSRPLQVLQLLTRFPAARAQRLEQAARTPILRRKHARVIAAVRITLDAQSCNFSRPITIIQVGPVVTGPRLVNLPVAGQHFELEQRVDTAHVVGGLTCSVGSAA